MNDVTMNTVKPDDSSVIIWECYHSANTRVRYASSRGLKTETSTTIFAITYFLRQMTPR